MIHSTQRCIIHHLSSADIPDAIQLFTNKQVRKYLGGTLTEQQAKEKLCQWANNQDGRYYCIRCRYSNAFIGIVSVTDHHDGKYQELSYQYLPQWWEQGIAKETLHELLQYFKSSCTDKIKYKTGCQTLLSGCPYSYYNEVLTFRR